MLIQRQTYDHFDPAKNEALQPLLAEMDPAILNPLYADIISDVLSENPPASDEAPEIHAAVRKFIQELNSQFCNDALDDILADIKHGIENDKVDEDELLLYCYSNHKLTIDSHSEHELIRNSSWSFKDFGIHPTHPSFRERLVSTEERGTIIDWDWFCLSKATVKSGIMQFPEASREALLSNSMLPSTDIVEVYNDAGSKGLKTPSFIGCFAHQRLFARCWDQVVSRRPDSKEHAKGGSRFLHRNASILKPKQVDLVKKSALLSFIQTIENQLGETHFSGRIDEEHSNLIEMERGIVFPQGKTSVNDLCQWFNKRGICKRPLKIADTGNRFISIEFDEAMKSDAWRILSEETDSLRVIEGLDDIAEIVDSLA